MPSILRPLRHCALLLGLLAGAGAGAQTVSNTATLRWTENGAARSVPSNTVSFTRVAARVRTTLSFRLPPKGFVPGGVGCRAGTPPTATAAPVDAATLAASAPLESFDPGEPMIVVLSSPASNLDPAVRETMTVQATAAGQRVDVILTETGPDTGVFAGAVTPGDATNPGTPSPCQIAMKRGDTLSIVYSGDADSLGSSASTLVDPYGIVFDSRTGKPVNGATVTLLDAAGQPASVYGDDGTSAYPSTMLSGTTVTDAANRPYPGSPGRYRFPHVAPGRYTVKVTPPAGYSAPSVATPAALAALTAPDGTAFEINDASYGRDVAVAAGTTLVADVPLDPAAAPASLLVTKIASVRDASPGDFVQYRLTVSNRGSDPTGSVVLSDTLPSGLAYRRGSTRGIAEPAVGADGRVLAFTLPALAAGGSAELSYVVNVAPGAPSGEAINRARVTAGGASNEAAAAVQLHPLLNTDALTLIGRVTAGACGDPPDHRQGVPGVRLLLEDGTFTVTDRDGLYHIEGVRPGRHVVQLDTGSVPASLAPVACDNDTRAAGSAISRFVEGAGGLLKRVDFQLAPTGKRVVAAEPGPAVVDDATAAGGNRQWLAGEAPGVGWVFPAEDYNPRAPVLRVAVKHRPGQRVALTVNGAMPDPLLFDATDSDDAAGVAVSHWSGLPLTPGDNRLEARVLERDGRIAETLTRVVHLSGPGMRADFVPTASRLVADGVTRPLVAVRVTDAAGRPVRAGTLVPFVVDAPYLAADAPDARALAGQVARTQAARVVGDDGVAFVALQPTTTGGAVRLVVTLTDGTTARTSEVHAWLAATVKDWIVVGFGAGSIGFDTLARHAEALPPHSAAADGEIAFYAKGRIKGSWLLTMSYDSTRRYDPDRGLLGQIDPNRYYTVYGDGADQGHDASTQKKLYLRLERREAYALFGDLQTGFNDAQLTRYNRTLTGFKAAYEGRRLRATAVVARTDQLYRRDEIPGNGLSGPYRLAATAIVPNSDQIAIETRNRYNSAEVLSSRPLTRYLDYDINTQAGVISFKAPVLSRDAALNFQVIVVNYEVDGGRDGRLAAAVRVSTRLADGRVDIGAGVIRDETAGIATVVGVDMKARPAPGWELRSEVARGGVGGLAAGGAYLFEVAHHAKSIDLLAYDRQQDLGFGVGQQNLVEAGTRRLGIDLRVALADRLSLQASGWWQQQLDGPGDRLALDARLEWRRANGTVFLGTQLADDKGIAGGSGQSRLLTLGGSQSLLNGALDVAGQTQIAPGGADGSVDFPVRQQITLGWRVRPGIRLIGGYELESGADGVAQTARVGFDLAPWRGAHLTSTLDQQDAGDNGPRTYAVYGLHQSLPIGTHWTIDATLDASNTLTGHVPTGAAINAFQAIGTDAFASSSTQAGTDNADFVAATAGASYHAERWQLNGRLERRTGGEGTRWGVTAGFLQTLGEGTTLASGLKSYRLVDQAGATAVSGQADVALAWRLVDSRWAVLDRLSWRHERADAGVTDANSLGVTAAETQGVVTTRFVNNLAVDWRTGPEGLAHGFEGSIYYGAKYIEGRLADDRYDGFVDAWTLDLRRDLGRKFDVGVQGSVQHAWSAGQIAWSGGPTVGLSPGGGLWLSAGYNVAGYRDRDFEADRYTRAGPYVTMRFKFDQHTVSAATRALFGGRP